MENWKSQLDLIRQILYQIVLQCVYGSWDYTIGCVTSGSFSELLKFWVTLWIPAGVTREACYNFIKKFRRLGQSKMSILICEVSVCNQVASAFVIKTVTDLFFMYPVHHLLQNVSAKAGTLVFRDHLGVFFNEKIYNKCFKQLDGATAVENLTEMCTGSGHLFEYLYVIATSLQETPKRLFVCFQGATSLHFRSERKGAIHQMNFPVEVKANRFFLLHRTLLRSKHTSVVSKEKLPAHRKIVYFYQRSALQLKAWKAHLTRRINSQSLEDIIQHVIGLCNIIWLV